MERWHAKAISGIAIFVIMMACFLLPIKLTGLFRRKGDSGQYILDLMACFAGGVFFAAYLIFMAPSVRELLLESVMRPNGIAYPLPDMLIGTGFFILLLLNRVVITMSKVSKRRIQRLKGSKSSPEMIVAPAVHSRAGDTNSETVAGTSANGILFSVEDKETASELVEKPNRWIDTEELQVTEDCHIHGNNPYPLPRRSSITDVAQQDSTVRSIVMMLALSLDSFLEGVTTGLKTTVVEVWAIFIGNLVHETVIAFCLGLQLVRVHDSYKPVFVAAIAYSLMNPIGLLLSTSIFESMETSPQVDLLNGLFQALISGCFIYVTFCEILEGQITHRTSFAKIAAMFAGYVTLALFAAVPGSSGYSFINCDSSDITNSNISSVNKTSV